MKIIVKKDNDEILLEQSVNSLLIFAGKFTENPSKQAFEIKLHNFFDEIPELTDQDQAHINMNCFFNFCQMLASSMSNLNDEDPFKIALLNLLDSFKTALNMQPLGETIQ